MLKLLVIALTLYLIGAFYSIYTFATKSRRPDRDLKIIIGLGFVAHTAAIVAAWREAGHFPVISPKEVSSFIGWAIVGYYLAVSKRYHTRALPAFLFPLVYLFMFISLLLPSRAVPQLLESAIYASQLTKIILPVHVTLVIVSYAAFAVTFVCSLMYLIQEHELKAKRFGASSERLPALNTCDEICYRSVTIGFVLLTLGVATGIFWNNQRDGRYWHNDPKEVMALVTWIVYLFPIHYRVTAGWRGRRAAWMSIAGFVAVILTWLGARGLGG
ncbi:MAG TPA: cytochrome c biogenesis protein CcsA, partial [Blastocatellia bacterium]|nr:cytochrome c biogenesis protein CcsA [Blastocatellia bacterium]